MPPDPSKAASKTPAEPSFEDLLSELEEIIHRVETGEAGLERSIAEYERGVGLIKRCREILSHAEQKVEELGRSLSEGPGDDEKLRAGGR